MPTTRSRILIVDDNQDSADGLAMMLEMQGRDVKVAYDGVSALKRIEEYKPKIVLLDLGMPGMDGYAVARETRRRPGGRDIVLIALTGWGQEEDRRRTHEAGFDQHLTKPVDLDALQALLGSV
jgi:CheY-like chemotaxis protein